MKIEELELKGKQEQQTYIKGLCKQSNHLMLTKFVAYLRENGFKTEGMLIFIESFIKEQYQSSPDWLK
jgi:hypothetical protein